MNSIDNNYSNISDEMKDKNYKDKLNKKLKPNGFIAVYKDFTLLGLKPIDNLILSIIYSYCQQYGEFKGSVNTLIKETNTVKVTVLKSLKYLESLNYIIKLKSKGRTASKYKINHEHLYNTITVKQQYQNGIVNSTENEQLNNINSTENEQLQYRNYTVNSTETVHSNNIYNNTSNNIYIGDCEEMNNQDDVLPKENKSLDDNKDNSSSHKKKKDNYTCDSYKADIEAYTEDKEIQEALIDFYDMRKNIKKPISTPRATKTLLNKLDKLSNGDKDYKIELINEAVLRNWQSFYKPKEQQEQNKEESSSPAFKYI